MTSTRYCNHDITSASDDRRDQHPKRVHVEHPSDMGVDIVC